MVFGRTLELVDPVGASKSGNEARISILRMKMIWIDAVNDKNVKSLMMNFSGLCRHVGSLGPKNQNFRRVPIRSNIFFF